MSLLVTGSMALDTITTPHGTREAVLGGAASFFSVGARHFTDVRLVAVIGDDFPDEHVAMLRDRGIDIEGLERRAGAKTFRWTGRYAGRMDVAETLDTQLNVLGEFKPTLPGKFTDTPFAFLANGDPVTQAWVRDQLSPNAFVFLDTMNFWIEGSRDALLEAIRKVNGVVMNDDEARALGGSDNLIASVNRIADMGVSTLVVKKGEHGAILMKDGELFALPAYPLEAVFDPTGAGDTFASGFMGAVAESGDTTFQGLKRALAYGTVVASFTVEGFGLERLLEIDREEIDRRLEVFLKFTGWE
ncbi:MAG: sugar kinase [Planctomycetes bacterium]|nr:sugar kinase [Planctomycetota bacterium]